MKHIKATIAGTYSAASAADGGALLTPDLVGLNFIDHVAVHPSFTADTIEEQAVSVGPSTSTTPGWVIALTNKDDDLETGAVAVTGVTFFATVTGN